MRLGLGSNDVPADPVPSGNAVSAAPDPGEHGQASADEPEAARPQHTDEPPRRRGGGGIRRLTQLTLLGAVVGLAAAALAAAFLALVHTVEHWLWSDLPAALGAATPPWYLVLGLPVVGAAIVAVARKLLPGDGSHRPVGGLDPAPSPLRDLPGVALAALGSLSFGAVLGPEAPLIALVAP